LIPKYCCISGVCALNGADVIVLVGQAWGRGHYRMRCRTIGMPCQNQAMKKLPSIVPRRMRVSSDTGSGA
jgi:hypothetical protein